LVSVGYIGTDIVKTDKVKNRQVGIFTRPQDLEGANFAKGAIHEKHNTILENF
jgi:hypothetical protein